MKSIKMFGKSVPLLAIVMVSLLAIGASAYLVDYVSNRVEAEVLVISSMEVGITTGEKNPTWATAQTYRPPSPGSNPTPTEVADWGYCECGADDWWGTPVHINEQESIDAGGSPDHTWYPTGGRLARAAYTGGMKDGFPEGYNGNPDYDGVYVIGWTESDWTTGTPVTIMGGETITLYLMSANLADVHINAHEEIRVSNPGTMTKADFVNVTYRTDSIYGDNGYGKLHIDNLGEGDMWQVDDNTCEFWPADSDSGWGAGETDVSQWQITFKPNAFGTYTFSYRITALPEP